MTGTTTGGGFVPVLAPLPPPHPINKNGRNEDKMEPSKCAVQESRRISSARPIISKRNCTLSGNQSCTIEHEHKAQCVRNSGLAIVYVAPRTLTSSASTCQCLGCGRRRPLRECRTRTRAKHRLTMQFLRCWHSWNWEQIATKEQAVLLRGQKHCYRKNPS